MKMGECPVRPRWAQTPRDVRVREHVLVVIIIDELVAKGLAEDQPGDCGKENTDAEYRPTIVQSSRPVSRLRREESAAMTRGCRS